MTCPWDKHILMRKNTETVENCLQRTVELLLLRRMCFLSKKPWKAKMLNASRELSQSREDHEMPDYFWVSSFKQKFLDIGQPHLTWCLSDGEVDEKIFVLLCKRGTQCRGIRRGHYISQVYPSKHTSLHLPPPHKK